MTSSTVFPELVVSRDGAAGVILLNRPKAINALTLNMIGLIDEALDALEADPAIAVIILEGAGERGLCAGADIRTLHDNAVAGGDFGRTFFGEEYRLNVRIAELAKPYVAFMDGVVMGGGVGLSSHARHRVVTERSKVAMPETGLGFFPDVGGTWLLSRAPGELGTYLGLTGAVMSGADAVHCGFADTLIASQSWPALREQLTALTQGATQETVAALIRGCATPASAPLAARAGSINQAFAHDNVGAIFRALEADGSEFAQTTLRTMQAKSPRGLAVTLSLLRLARGSASLRECLIREFRAALEVFASKDFIEGVRATIIDRTHQPRWSPARVEDVTAEIIARYLAPHGEDLMFPA